MKIRPATVHAALGFMNVYVRRNCHGTSIKLIRLMKATTLVRETLTPRSYNRDIPLICDEPCMNGVSGVFGF